MDPTILTMVFCLILLVLVITVLTALSGLKLKVNAHLDRTDLHSEKLATIISILQQIEAQQHLMFSNAPPVPGEKEYNWKEEIHKPEVRTVFLPADIEVVDLPCSKPYHKSPMPGGCIQLQHLPKARKPRKDAGIKRGPYAKTLAKSQ